MSPGGRSRKLSSLRSFGFGAEQPRRIIHHQAPDVVRAETRRPELACIFAESFHRRRSIELAEVGRNHGAVESRLRNRPLDGFERHVSASMRHRYETAFEKYVASRGKLALQRIGIKSRSPLRVCDQDLPHTRRASVPDQGDRLAWAEMSRPENATLGRDQRQNLEHFRPHRPGSIEHRQAARLPRSIFTPATKAESGHDENIDFETVASRLGRETADTLRRLTLQCYERGAALAESRGIIVADTKFEFGRRGDRLLLVDEALTPDSSRFWPADRYAPGQSPPSFDKQFVRDWLERTSWDKNSPPPRLPADIVAETRAKYVEALTRLTGRALA